MDTNEYTETTDPKHKRAACTYVQKCTHYSATRLTVATQQTFISDNYV